MALTAEQRASRLFKKGFGLAETLTDRAFFEEAQVGQVLVLPSQIWAEGGDIPTPAPTLTDGQTSGVVQYYETLELTHIPGSQGRAFQDNRLKDAIDFTTDATYNYKLYENDGTTVIADGLGDWLVDREAGVLTFYGTLPGTVDDTTPPRISFYKYTGSKGLEISGATSGINVKEPCTVATLDELSGVTYTPSFSGFTGFDTGLTIDGYTDFQDDDRILVKNQVNQNENGIYVVSGDTLYRSESSDGNPLGEVGVNDYTFIFSGTTLKATSWVIGSTDAADPNKIVVGTDTQVWQLFSQSIAYTADGLAIKLDGQEFYLDLDEGGVYGSGMEQSVDGLRILPSLLADLSGSTDALSSLDTALSTEIVTRSGETASLDTALSSEISTRTSETGSLDVALSTEIVTRSGETSSLSTGISTETSTRTSETGSLFTALSTEIVTRSGETGSLSTAIDGLTGTTEDITSLNTALSSEISTRTSETGSLDTALSTEIVTRSGETGSLSTGISTESSTRLSADTSLATAISTISGDTVNITDILNNGEVLGLSGGELTGFTYETDFTSVNTAISNEIVTRSGETASLSTALSSEVSTRTSETGSLDTALSTEIVTRSGETSSLSTLVDSLTGTTTETVSLSTALSNEIVTRSGETSSLDIALSTEIVTRSGETASLDTALSSEISTRTSETGSLHTALENFSGVTSATAGSGLTYNSNDESLNVNVDDYTVKIVNDEIRTPEGWIEVNTTTTVSGATSGATNITLTYEPVGYVSAYINGVEYLVSPTSAPSTNAPFFFDTAIPTVGSILWFDPVTAGFDLISGTDLVMAKYHHISTVI